MGGDHLEISLVSVYIYGLLALHGFDLVYKIYKKFLSFDVSI